MHYHERIERLELKVKELEAQAQRMWDWTDFANDRLMATKPGDVLRCSECDESGGPDDRQEMAGEALDPFG